MKNCETYVMQPMHAASVILSLVAGAKSFILPPCLTATLLHISNSRNLSRFGWLTSHDDATISRHSGSREIANTEFRSDCFTVNSGAMPGWGLRTLRLPDVKPPCLTCRALCPAIFLPPTQGSPRFRAGRSFSLPCKCDLVLIA